MPPFPSIPPPVILSPQGTVSVQLIATDAYARDTHNVVSFANNHLVSFNTRQYVGFWDRRRELVLGYRDHTPASAWNTYTYDGAGGKIRIRLNRNDCHDIVALGFDKNGYAHVAYGMHADRLRYRISEAPFNLSALGEERPMRGAHETAATYPLFVQDPKNNDLYFLFRDGSASRGDIYFYRYDAGRSAWEPAPGTGMDGLLLYGRGNNVGVYLHGPPCRDARGHYHFSWCYRGRNAEQNQELGYVKWDGTVFLRFDGSKQPVPITRANNTAVIPIAPRSGLANQCHMACDCNGTPYVAYIRNDTRQHAQYYVSFPVNGSWATTRLTDFNIPAWPKGPLARPELFFDKRGTGYVLGTNPSEPGTIRVIETHDHFKSWRHYPLAGGFFPGLELTKDTPLWESTNIFSAVAQTGRRLFGGKRYGLTHTLVLLSWDPQNTS